MWFNIEKYSILVVLYHFLEIIGHFNQNIQVMVSTFPKTTTTGVEIRHTLDYYK